MQGRKDNFCLFHNSVKGFLSFLFFKFYIGAQLIDNVELVSGVQQSDSVIYMLSTLYQDISQYTDINSSDREIKSHYPNSLFLENHEQMLKQKWW